MIESASEVVRRLVEDEPWELRRTAPAPAPPAAAGRGERPDGLGEDALGQPEARRDRGRSASADQPPRAWKRSPAWNSGAWPCPWRSASSSDMAMRLASNWWKHRSRSRAPRIRIERLCLEGRRFSGSAGDRATGPERWTVPAAGNALPGEDARRGSFCRPRFCGRQGPPFPRRRPWKVAGIEQLRPPMTSSRLVALTVDHHRCGTRIQAHTGAAAEGAMSKRRSNKDTAVPGRRYPRRERESSLDVMVDVDRVCSPAPGKGRSSLPTAARRRRVQTR